MNSLTEVPAWQIIYRITSRYCSSQSEAEALASEIYWALDRAGELA